MDNSNGSQKANGENLMLNLGGLNTKREVRVFRKDNAVARREPQEHYLGSYKARCEKPRSGIGILEVHLRKK